MVILLGFKKKKKKREIDKWNLVKVEIFYIMVIWIEYICLINLYM